jgi:hypothetical protein
MSFERLVWMLIVIFFLHGCGGSNDVNSPESVPPTGSSQTPTTPPENNFQLIVKAPYLRIAENSDFYIDLRDIVDPDNVRRATTIEQTSGPLASLENEALVNYFRYKAPDMPANEFVSLTFTISAELATGTTVSEEITFEVMGYDGLGTLLDIFDPALKLIGSEVSYNSGNPILKAKGLHGIQTKIDGTESIVMVDVEREAWNLNVINGTFKQVTDLIQSGLGFNGLNSDFSRIGEESFLVLETIDNSILWFDYDKPDEAISGAPNYFSQRQQININAPCFFTGRRNTSQDFVWIGQHDTGFSLLQITPTNGEYGIALSFESAVLQNLGNGRSLCTLFPTILPERLVPPNFFEPLRYSSLIAIDYISNEIVLYGDPQRIEQYEELETIPLQANSDYKLSIVDVTYRGTPGQSPQYLLVLMSDGLENGEHRLIYIAQDGTSNEITQQTFSWSDGLPIALIHSSLTPNQTISDVLVVSQYPNTSKLFLNEQSFAGNGNLPLLLSPETINTGENIGSAVYSNNALWVSNHINGELRFITDEELTEQLSSLVR